MHLNMIVNFEKAAEDYVFNGGVRTVKSTLSFFLDYGLKNLWQSLVIVRSQPYVSVDRLQAILKGRPGWAKKEFYMVQ